MIKSRGGRHLRVVQGILDRIWYERANRRPSVWWWHRTAMSFHQRRDLRQHKDKKGSRNRLCQSQQKGPTGYKCFMPEFINGKSISTDTRNIRHGRWLWRASLFRLRPEQCSPSHVAQWIRRKICGGLVASGIRGYCTQGALWYETSWTWRSAMENLVGITHGNFASEAGVFPCPGNVASVPGPPADLKSKPGPSQGHYLVPRWRCSNSCQRC